MSHEGSVIREAGAEGWSQNVQFEWEAPHVQLASLAESWGYQQMIAEWAAALKFGPDDPFYAAKLKVLGGWRRIRRERWVFYHFCKRSEDKTVAALSPGKPTRAFRVTPSHNLQ
jgi:hypothetical protein